MEKFLLYDMKTTDTGKLKPRDRYSNEKDFFINKFRIPLDKIPEINRLINKQDETLDIIEVLYRSVYTTCEGYSLKYFATYGYKSYMHTPLKPSLDTLQLCEEQIKRKCILSALYTLEYHKNNTLIPFIEVANTYSTKKHFSIDSFGQNIKLIYEGYSGSKTEAGNKIRNNFDKLYQLAVPLIQRLEEERKIDKDCKEVTYPAITESLETKIFHCKTSYKDHLPIYAGSYLINAVELSIRPENPYKGRFLPNFLSEFTYDLVVNNMDGGFNIDRRLEALARNHHKQEVFRRETRKFINGLIQVEKNFHPLSTSSKDDIIYNNLYYFKKESIFHTTLFNKVLNKYSNTLINYLTELIDMPIVPNIIPFLDLFSEALRNNHNLKFIILYLTDILFPVFESCFFISLCEHYNYNIDEMYNALQNHIIKNNIHFVIPKDSINLNVASNNDVSIIGESILHGFMQMSI